MPRDAPTPRLTTTSYALLGLLAIRSWTTYELARQMDRSLGRMWPRARSKIYEEPRKLVAYGLATAARGAVGRRPHTLYSITPRGRAVLAHWLGAPTAGTATGPTLESEQLLKVFFAEHGTRADLLATLDSLRAWAAADRAEHAAVARGYLAGDGAFPERGAQLALTGRFLADFTEMVGRWADWAVQQVEQWPDDPVSAEADRTVWEQVAARGG